MTIILTRKDIEMFIDNFINNSDEIIINSKKNNTEKELLIYNSFYICRNLENAKFDDINIYQKDSLFYVENSQLMNYNNNVNFTDTLFLEINVYNFPIINLSCFEKLKKLVVIGKNSDYNIHFNENINEITYINCYKFEDYEFKRLIIFGLKDNEKLPERVDDIAFENCKIENLYYNKLNSLTLTNTEVKNIQINKLNILDCNYVNFLKIKNSKLDKLEKLIIDNRGNQNLNLTDYENLKELIVFGNCNEIPKNIESLSIDFINKNIKEYVNLKYLNVKNLENINYLPLKIEYLFIGEIKEKYMDISKFKNLKIISTNFFILKK